MNHSVTECQPRVFVFKSPKPWSSQAWGCFKISERIEDSFREVLFFGWFCSKVSMVEKGFFPTPPPPPPKFFTVQLHPLKIQSILKEKDGFSTIIFSRAMLNIRGPVFAEKSMET